MAEQCQRYGQEKATQDVIQMIFGAICDCKSLVQNRLRFQGCLRIRRLSDFSLRQVIAPSNDVMRRMLPAIHLAILQGLNEFRDVVPSFMVNFPKLNRFLLVDVRECYNPLKTTSSR